MSAATPSVPRIRSVISPGVSLHLDALRGVSALLVLVNHFSEIVLSAKLGIGDTQYRASSVLASYAVMAFFALSGFMITATMWRNVQRNRGRFDPRRFAADRLYRLYPPLLAALAVCFIVFVIHDVIAGSTTANMRLPGDVWASRGSIAFHPLESVLTLGYVQGLDPRIAMTMDGPLWSLGYEFWFYVLAGLATVAVLNRHIIAAVSAVVLLLIAPLAGNGQFYGFLIVWLIGAGWFLLLTRPISPRAFVRAGGAAAGALVVVAAAALVIGGPRAVKPTYTGASMVLQIALVALGSILLAAYLKRRGQRVSRVVRAAAPSAAYSYTLYVVHFPLLLLLFALANPYLAPRSVAYSAAFCIIVAPFIVLGCRSMARVVEDRARWRALISQLTPRRRPPVVAADEA